MNLPPDFSDAIFVRYFITYFTSFFHINDNDNVAWLSLVGCKRTHLYYFCTICKFPFYF